MMTASLPSNWVAVPLSAVCEINPRTKSELKPDDLVSFVPMAAVSEHSGSIVASETRPLEEVRKGFTPFQDGDVLFAKITPCMENGKAAIAHGLMNGQGYGSTEFHVLRPSSLVKSEWLFAIIRTAEFRRAAAASFQGAVGQQRVTADFLQRFRIPLPPLSEQQRIVDILQEAEEIRRLRAQAEAKTADLIPALFQAGFAHSLSQSEKNRKIRLEEMADVQGGIQVTRARENAPLKVPYLRVANVQRDALDLAEIKEIGVTETELERTRLQKGDILVVEGHGNLEELGRAAIWSGELETCTHQNHLIRVRCKPGIEPSYVLSMLISSLGRQHFKSAGNTTSGLNTISTNIVRSFRLPAPSPEAMNEFAALRAAALGLRGTGLQKANLLADKLAASLSAHAFTGQLTEGWREKHREQLTAQSAERDRLLAASSSRRLIVSAVLKAKFEATGKPRIDHEALSADQQALLHAIEDYFTSPKPGQAVWFTAELLSRRAGGAWTGNARATQNLLALLVTRGLVLAASREQVDEITEETVFGTAYRLPMQRHDPDSVEEGEPFPGDFGRRTEMERLAERLYKMRMLP